jgi:predicted dehydrogenase
LGWPVGVTAFKTKASSLDCDIDDIYQILLKYGDQKLGHLQVDVIARAPTRAFRVLGNEGSMEWNAIEKSLRLYTAATGVWETILENQQVEAGYSEMSPEQMYMNEIKSFIDAMQGIKDFPHSLEEDMRILKILNKIEESSDQGLHINL